MAFVNQLKRGLKWSGLWVVLAAISSTAVLSQSANFGTLTLGANKNAGTLTGTMGGSTSLPAIVSNSDRHNNKCLGFGDPTPDHLLVLQQNFQQLRLQVNQSDATIVIQGPNGIIRCGDARLADTNWTSGTYKLWIGSITPGRQQDYILTVRQ